MGRDGERMAGTDAKEVMVKVRSWVLASFASFAVKLLFKLRKPIIGAGCNTGTGGRRVHQMTYITVV